MGFRKFIETLEKSGELTRVTKPVSTEYEIASIIEAMHEKPVFFERVKESKFPVVAGLLSSKDLIARAIGSEKDHLLPYLSSAIEKPIVPTVIADGECQEVVENEVDLTKLPIMRYTEKDGGKYIPSAISIVKDLQTANRNICFHRLMLLDKSHFAVRIVEDRGTDTFLKKAGGEIDVAICLGNSTAVLLAAATSLPKGVDELGMANALEKTELVKCKTVNIEVPKNCEMVLEGRITKEKTSEGPFLDLTGTIDKVCRCRDVYITPGGCSWLHAVIKIKKEGPNDGKRAIAAAFEGHKSLKHCVVVDEDIDIYDPQDIEWAIATRFQADKDGVILLDQPGSSLDPSGDLSEGKKARTAKAGLDATIPTSTTGKGFTKEQYRKIDLSSFV